jgi:dynein intermediate chain 1, axonemal
MKNKMELEELIKLKLTALTIRMKAALLALPEASVLISINLTPKFSYSALREVSLREILGRIHKYRKSYSDQCYETYQGHLPAVYKVRSNHIYPKTFILASADWSVKI